MTAADATDRPAKQLLHLVFGGELKSLADIEFANLDAARHRRHLSQLRGGLQSLEGRGAAHRGQCAHALLHRPHPPPARPQHGTPRRAPDAVRRCRLATPASAASVALPAARPDRYGRSESAHVRIRRALGKRSQIAAQDASLVRARRARARHAAALRRRLDLAALAPDRWSRCCSPRGLAATTGGYPLIIKHSFDSLMKADSGALPWVLAAIVARHHRAQHLPLPAPGDDRAHRHAHDDRHPEGGLRPPDQLRLRAPDARDHRPPRLAAHQRPDLHPAGRAGVDDRLRQGRPVGDRAVRRHALHRLDADADRARRSIPSRCCRSAASASGCARWRAAPRPSSAT